MQFGIYSLSYISPAAESHREGAGGFDAASFETTQRRKIGPKALLGKVKLRALRLERAHRDHDCTHVSVTLYRKHTCMWKDLFGVPKQKKLVSSTP